MRNNLIFTNIWNSCAGGNGADSPRYIMENLREVLNKSREETLFNQNRLDPEDDKALEDICRDLDIMTNHLEYIEKTIENIALKYKKKELRYEICIRDDRRIFCKTQMFRMRVFFWWGADPACGIKPGAHHYQPFLLFDQNSQACSKFKEKQGGK